MGDRWLLKCLMFASACLRECTCLHITYLRAYDTVYGKYRTPIKLHVCMCVCLHECVHYARPRFKGPTTRTDPDSGGPVDHTRSPFTLSLTLKPRLLVGIFVLVAARAS